MSRVQQVTQSQASKVSMNLITHLENELGPICEGWGEAGQIRVAKFQDQPWDGVSTYSTIGFSHHPLSATAGEQKRIRAELLFSAYSQVRGSEIASVLLTFSEYLIGQGRALLRGDVVGPSRELIPGSQLCALYASMPVFFDDNFSVFCGSDFSTVLIWLIPLYESEANYVKACGWDRFEDRMESMSVDFCNLRRPIMPL